MNDLISRKQIMDEAKRLSGPMTGDGWDNWGVYALIERQPSVHAVPLDKLCELLNNFTVCAPCILCRKTTPEWRKEHNRCPTWKIILTKWMEEQDESD